MIPDFAVALLRFKLGRNPVGLSAQIEKEFTQNEQMESVETITHREHRPQFTRDQSHREEGIEQVMTLHP